MKRDGVLIIAEAGVNHNGNLSTAKQLAEKAKDCGADIVKYQTFVPEKIASRHARMAEYQKINTGEDMTQEEMLSKLCLSKNEFIELAEYCDEIGIQFLSTPFDIESIIFLKELQSIWKIPSGEITNYPYLVEIAKTKKDIILSTGMCSLGEVDEALSVLYTNGAEHISLLHCTTNYPTPMEDVNLRAMLTLSDHCKCDVGYSDHTRGIEVPVAAVALGAKIIEKHFTLDRNMDGPDHKASLEPNEFSAMVEAIRNIEVALGDGVKAPAQSEKANIEIARKSIVAARDIRKGEVFSEENLTTKRPGNGLSPMLWSKVIGKVAKRSFAEDELIEV